MFDKQDKNKYVKDIEYIKNLKFLNNYGIFIEDQVKRPYKNTKKIIIPKDFSINNINELLYINDELGRLEFIIFNRFNDHFTLTEYNYIGYDYDKSKTPILIIRNIEYYDKNYEFYNYLKSSKLSIENFFLNKLHFKFLMDQNPEITHIVLIKLSEVNKYKYTIIKSTEKEYFDTLIKDKLDNDSSIYNIEYINCNKSLMEEGTIKLMKYIYSDSNQKRLSM